MKSGRPRVNFIAAWALVQLAKLVLAARLPLYVDEAFYAWEARHPAWAYSDLPGLTAWMARAGLALGDSALCLRLPFLLIGASLPWLARRLALRVGDAASADRAAWLALLMPLSGLMGVLALPDVALVAAALLAMDAVLALRARTGDRLALAQLALALATGALAHYRFGAVLLAGGAAMLVDPGTRAWLRRPGLWLALAIGALAWWPALHWNLAHGEAGLRFHLLERNPWQFDAAAARWLPIQLAIVTPPLFLLLLAGLREGWRHGGAARVLAVAGGLGGPALFVLAFFADRERVSFHWPIAGWLVLMPLGGMVLARWGRAARLAVFGVAGIALLAGLGFLAMAGAATWRERLAAHRLYPNDLGGWPAISADAQAWPRDRPWIAGDFELAAQLAFATGRRDIHVLDSPLNHKHGRAAQLALWGLDRAPAPAPVVLAIEDTATPMKRRLREYHARCRLFPALPPPRIVAADHGRKRYFVYLLDTRVTAGACDVPALSWVDAPRPGARVRGDFDATGWAFKDATGLAAVELLVDGRVVARARYGLPMPGVAGYWQVSTDPNHPRVGWQGRVPTRGLAPGRHWLGLRLHGANGTVEDAPEQAFVLSP